MLGEPPGGHRNHYAQRLSGRVVVGRIRPEALSELLRNHADEYVLLDVREPDEREVARIEPSLHIPMNEVSHRLAEIPKDRKLVVYCHHGTRSLMVASYLEGAGYPSPTNLDGGIDAWSQRVDRKVPRYS